MRKNNVLEEQIELANTLLQKYGDMERVWENVFTANRAVGIWYEQLRTISSRLEKQVRNDDVSEDELNCNQVALAELIDGETLDLWLTKHIECIVDTFGPNGPSEDASMIEYLESTLAEDGPGDNREQYNHYQEYLAKKNQLISVNN